MRSEVFHVVDYKEVESLVADFLKLKKYETLVADMGQNDNRWCNDSIVSAAADTDFEVVQPNHDKALGEVRANKRVKWNWELNAILTETARQGKIPYGRYLIEICW